MVTPTTEQPDIPLAVMGRTDVQDWDAMNIVIVAATCNCILSKRLRSGRSPLKRSHADYVPRLLLSGLVTLGIKTGRKCLYD